MCNDQDNLLLAVFFKGRKYIALKLSALKFFLIINIVHVYILKNWDKKISHLQSQYQEL